MVLATINQALDTLPLKTLRYAVDGAPADLSGICRVDHGPTFQQIDEHQVPQLQFPVLTMPMPMLQFPLATSGHPADNTIHGSSSCELRFVDC
jgi:hypothetical protein